MILDDQKEMEKLDLSKVVASLEKFPEQCEEAIASGKKFAGDLKLKKPERVFVCGMGGSGIVGDMLAGVFPNNEIRVLKGYGLPAYVKNGDMVFFVSYSGDTEETLSAFREAVKRKCEIFAITSGGELERECCRRGLACMRVPKGLKPRFAIGHMLFPIIAILEKAKFLEKQNLDLVIKNLKETRDEIKSSKLMKDNPAKRIAYKLINSVPVIHGFGIYEPVVYRARTQFNENSKVVAMCETYPELNHNSILGWEDTALSRNFSVIIIRDNSENERMRRRINFTKELLKRSARSVIEVWSVYPYELSRALSTMYVLDFVSIYLGMLRGKDPGDDSLISKLKTILKEQ
ncbi:MAG: bifunctional phosphoglucose/phosphomannose isomerase [Candidatus Aenigmarchaeota archaeon]|nr:bifunctional phosphoglucose/phosphomannose isomerase [Candidatus Aenigmarchaeota archaeon]